MKVFVNINSITSYHLNLENEFDYKSFKPKYHCIEKINKMYDNGDEIVYLVPKELNYGVDWEDFLFKKLVEWGCSFNDIICGIENVLLDSTFDGEITIIEEIKK